MDTTFYRQLINKKRDWQPIKPTEQQIIQVGSKKLLQRALALSLLELPVGEWVSEELSKRIFDPTIQELLSANIQEEIRHDIALNNIRSVFPVPAELDMEVQGFIKEATRLGDLYSPLQVTAVLESSIFFVILPMFRFLGGSAMRTTANDISLDENIHVSTNVQLCLDLNYRRGVALNKLRENIIDWLVQDLTSSENKYLDKNFWQKTSYSLYNNGKAEGLSATKRSVMPAFFETNNTSLAIYS